MDNYNSVELTFVTFKNRLSTQLTNVLVVSSH